MNFDRETVTRLRETPITDYLYNAGIEPVHSSGSELVYCSPLTGERTPSFYVNAIKNRFNCFSSGEKGDIIHLVCLLEKKPFKSALERLSTFNPEQQTYFSFSSQSVATIKPLEDKTSAISLLDEGVLQNPTLIDYVSSRCIPPIIAKEYLREIRYCNSNREYYAAGFKTDKASYVLRSKAFKGWLGQSSIRTIPVAGSRSINLFEGFFDFLSALAYYKRLEPSCTTIVLNSTTNINQALPTLQEAKLINCYFDNDTTGKGSYGKLAKKGLPVKDRSTLYQAFNDFNEMLCSSTT